MDAAQILAELEEQLVLAIPRAVKKQKISEPIYSLRIEMHGTDLMAEDRVPGLLAIKESRRQWALRAKGDKAPHYLWCAGELDGATAETRPIRVRMEDPSIARLVGAWFDAQPETDLPSDGDTVSYREMFRRVAARLNRMDWRPAAPVSDDFVVLPADAQNGGDYEDLLACVPARRLEQFRERGLLGRETWWTLGAEPTYGDDE